MQGVCLCVCTCLLAVQNFFWKNSSFIWMPTAERGTTQSLRHGKGTCVCCVCWSGRTLWSVSQQKSSFRQEGDYEYTHRVKVHFSLTPTEGTHSLLMQQTPAGQNGPKGQLHPASYMCQLIFLEGLVYVCVCGTVPTCTHVHRCR